MSAKQPFVQTGASVDLGSEPSVSPNFASDSFRNPNVGAFGQDGEISRSSRFLHCLLPGLALNSTRCIAARRLRALIGPWFTSHLRPHPQEILIPADASIFSRRSRLAGDQVSANS